MSSPIDESTFRWPRIQDATIERVAELMRDGKVSCDEATFASFEADLARTFQVKHALSYTNGTSACFAGLRALGIGEGHTVIAPAISHWSAVLPAAQCGARIVLVDIEPGTYHADLRRVRESIASHTKAVVLTHLFGMPAPADAFRELCDEHQLSLIEDVSHAPGATWSGQPLGSFGDFAFCSFQARKLISGGEGGALLTNNSELFYRAMELGHPRRLFGAPPPWRTLAGVGRGFKFRPSPIHVAMAADALAQLPDQIAVRRRACERLRGQLAETGFFARLDEPTGERVYYCCELLLANGLEQQTETSPTFRDQLVQRLQSSGLPVDYLYAFLPDHPAVAEHLHTDGDFPEARNVMRRILLMHAYTAYCEEAIDRHAKLIAETITELQTEVATRSHAPSGGK